MDSEKLKNLLESLIDSRFKGAESLVLEESKMLKATATALDEICSASGVKISRIPGKP